VESTRGQLLIAGPSLIDPNFQRSVVLIVEHTDEGAFGLVLNRPSETTVGEAVDELDAFVEEEDTLFIGGPVRQTALIVLAEFENAEQAAVVAFDHVGVLGWGPGQLDSELSHGDWILEPARHEDAFSDEPLALWESVLTRKGGSYALVARMPTDPSMN
jgi:putative transcriptional regulator